MKKQKDQPEQRCRDCIYCVPDLSNPSLKTGEPILGTCKHQKHLFLINFNICKNYSR